MKTITFELTADELELVVTALFDFNTKKSIELANELYEALNKVGSPLIVDK